MDLAEHNGKGVFVASRPQPSAEADAEMKHFGRVAFLHKRGLNPWPCAWPRSSTEASISQKLALAVQKQDAWVLHDGAAAGLGLLVEQARRESLKVARLGDEAGSSA